MTMHDSKHSAVRPLLAFVLLLLLLLGWLFGPELWLTVAYDRKKASGNLIYYDKRRPGLPGKERVVPDQVCPFCSSVDRSKKHSCLRPTKSKTLKPAQSVKIGGIEIPPDFVCTCPGPHY